MFTIAGTDMAALRSHVYNLRYIKDPRTACADQYSGWSGLALARFGIKCLEMRTRSKQLVLDKKLREVAENAHRFPFVEDEKRWVPVLIRAEDDEYVPGGTLFCVCMARVDGTLPARLPRFFVSIDGTACTPECDPEIGSDKDRVELLLRGVLPRQFSVCFTSGDPDVYVNIVSTHEC